MAGMLDSLRALFTGEEPAQPRLGDAAPDVDPLHLAACALLLEVAWADGEFSDAERKHLEGVLARHFNLSQEEGTHLLAVADEARRNSVDHYRFTSVLKKRYDTGQKMVMAEVIWGLALADGEVAEHEHYLTRKIANLLDLEPGYLSAAKSAAASRQQEKIE
jgi:uncharacterized tellurite resistance protein B-like protein